MLNADNLINLSGRLTRDAEVVMDGKQLRFDVAVDNSGYEKGSDSRAGFFTCKAWLTESDMTSVSTQKRLKELVDQKLLIKGAPVRIVGSISHERWTDDNDNRRSSVVVVVEDLTAYVARSKRDDSGEAAPAARTASGGGQSNNDSFSEPF